MLCALVRLEFYKFNRNAFLRYVDEGADIDYRMPEEDLNTPLHLAIISRNLDWIQFVLRHGADQTIPNKDGKTALELAEKSRSFNILKIIKQAMIDMNNVTRIDFQDATGEWVSTKSKILVIKKCPTFHGFVELSQQYVFQEALSKTSLFLIVVYLEQKPSIDMCELMQLNQVSTMPMILQVKFKSSNAIFYKNQGEDFKKLSINRNPITTTDVQYLDHFNFEFVCNLMHHKPKIFGTFKSNLLQMRMFNEALIEGLRLIEHAIIHQDIVVVKFLLLFKPDFYNKNGNKQRILEVAVEQSTLPILKILLEFQEENVNDNVKLQAKKQKALNLISDKGKNLLMIAVEKEKPEIIKFLIKCGLRFTSNVREFRNAYESALEIKDYDLVMNILKADGIYSEDFDYEPLHVAPENLQVFIRSAANFHKAIKNNNKTGVEEFIQQNPKLKFAYNTRNVSAMSTALKAKQFDIYSFLQSKGFSNGADDYHDEILKSLDGKEHEALRKAQKKYFKKSDSLHIMELLTKSSIGSDNEPEEFPNIQKFYETLDEMSELQPILKTVASSKNVKIVFDFNCGCVRGMDQAVLDEDVKGRTDNNLIMIGAKCENEAHLLGTLAHELTHYAIQMCYNNQSEPFNKNDHDQKTKFNKIVAKYDSEEFKKKSEIIESVYTCYEEGDRSSELIVRPPHLMALHKGEPDILKELRQIFQELFDFFKNYVLEDLMKEFPFMKDEHNIQELNKILLGNFDYLNEEKLFYPESSVGEFEKVLNTTENVSISSNLPWLVASSLVQHMKEKGVKKIDSSHIFIEIQQLVEETYSEKIEEAFSSKKKPKMFIIWEKDAIVNMQTVKKIISSFYPSGRLVLLSNTDFIFEDIPTQLEMSHKWKDLDDTSKDVIMNWNLKLQGKNISVHEIIPEDSEMFSQLSVKEIQALNGISLRTTEESQKEEKRIYIDRSFEYGGRVNKEESFSSEDILKMIEQQKIRIVLENVAGMGKSTTAKHLAGMFKERNCSKWVEYIDLKQHTTVFYEDGDLNQPEQVDVKFFSEKLFKLQSNLEQRLFEHMFNTQKAMFVFDGFDEINPKFKIFVLKLLIAVKESNNQLLVTTRTHCKDEINNVVDGSVMRLEPLTNRQSIDLIARLWQAKSVENEDHRDSLENLESKAAKLLEEVKNSMRWGDSKQESFDNPLQIIMLSEFDEWKHDSSKDAVTYNMFSFYQKFIDKNIDIWNEKGPLARYDSKILHMRERGSLTIHQETAVKVILDDKTYKELNFQEMTQTEDLMAVRIGILRYGSNGRIEFVHRTFAEYFLADYILSVALKDIGKSFLFLKVWKGIGYEIVRRFMNEALVESEERFDKTLSIDITKNFDNETFVISLANVIQEKRLKLLELFLTNDEFKNGQHDLIRFYKVLNNHSLLLDSVEHCTVEVFDDLWNYLTPANLALEMLENLHYQDHGSCLGRVLLNDDQEMVKYMLKTAVQIFTSDEFRSFLRMDAILESTHTSSSFVAIWTYIKEKFNDTEQAEVMTKILDSEDYGLVNAIKYNQDDAISLIFKSSQRLCLNIQEALGQELNFYGSFLHLAAQDGTFSVFKIVSNFMFAFIGKEDFKKILLRKAYDETILDHVKNELILFKVLKMLENYLSCDEFFDLINFTHKKKTFLKDVMDVYPINVFKEVWKIIQNKADNDVKLAGYKKLIFDEILKLENDEKINLLNNIINGVEMSDDEMSDAEMSYIEMSYCDALDGMN